MKHCKKFSGPIFSQNCPPLNPPPSHGSLQQISSSKVLLSSFPDPPSLIDFRWEERGTEDRGIISRFFFSVIFDEIFSVLLAVLPPFFAVRLSAIVGALKVSQGFCPSHCLSVTNEFFYATF